MNKEKIEAEIGELEAAINVSLRAIDDNDLWENNDKRNIRLSVVLQARRGMENAYFCGQEDVLKRDKEKRKKTSERLKKVIDDLKSLEQPRFTDLAYGLDLDSAIKKLELCYYLALRQED